MICEIGLLCNVPAAYTFESFEDNVVRRLCACEGHKHKALLQVIDPNTHYEHGKCYRNSTKFINTIVTVRGHGSFEIVRLGNVKFGPITQRNYWEDVYDALEDEVTRMGLFEEFETSERYEECKRLMLRIEQEHLNNV